MYSYITTGPEKTMTSPALAAPAPPRTLLLFWLGLALALGASGALAAVPPPGPQLVLLTLTALAIWAGTRAGPIREWIDRLPLQAFPAIHLIRFVGFWFLYLSSRGELAPTFANAAGIGDVIAASGAVGLLLLGPPTSRAKRGAWLAWNTIAFLDWVAVLGSVTLVALQGRADELAPLTRLPLSLLPTFIVPILIASQVFLFRRLGTSSRDA
jgi:hypothetical protein